MSRPLAIGSRIAVAVVALGLGASPRAARANGAFPESFQLILPADRPQQIVLATNFGMIISDDAGATWTWTCEQKATSMASLYALSAPPLDRFFALSASAGMAYSDDQSCSWTSAKGTVDSVLTLDYFPDPTDPLHVLAAGETVGPAASMSMSVPPPQVFPSSDGGKTFTAAVFTAPAGATLTGLEISRSDPKTIYLAMATMGTHPVLVRSNDGGQTWTPLDVEAFLGPNQFRIVAVDPTDPKVISVRVIAIDSDSLAISRDGGQTFTVALTVPGGQLTAYARLDDGTLLVAGKVIDQAVGYRSSDGGKTFTKWIPLTLGDGGVPVNPDAAASSEPDAAPIVPSDAGDGRGAGDARDAASSGDAAADVGDAASSGDAAADVGDAAGDAARDARAAAPEVALPPPEVPGVPHLIALATRDGKLYGAAKNYSDDWAVGVSTDDGLTFAPVMKYSDVKAIRACAQKTCKDSCEFQAGQFIWPAAICVGPPPKSGCGCALGPGDGAGGGAVAAAVLVAGLCVARGRRRRR